MGKCSQVNSCAQECRDSVHSKSMYWYFAVGGRKSTGVVWCLQSSIGFPQPVNVMFRFIRAGEAAGLQPRREVDAGQRRRESDSDAREGGHHGKVKTRRHESKLFLVFMQPGGTPPVPGRMAGGEDGKPGLGSTCSRAEGSGYFQLPRGRWSRALG